MHLKYIPVYIQQDTTLHSLFVSRNCSTCFGQYHHPSSEAQTTISTAFDICYTVTATCRYRGGVGTPGVPTPGTVTVFLMKLNSIVATEIGTVTNVNQWIGIKILTVKNFMRSGIFVQHSLCSG
jgi:hypothetical protein